MTTRLYYVPLLVLLLNCGRQHNQERVQADQPKQPPILTAAQSAPAPIYAEAAPSRPSPFQELTRPAPPAVRPPTPAAASPSAVRQKPQAFTATVKGDSSGPPGVGDLPPAPVVSSPAARPAANPPVSARTFLLGTATWEPVKPNRFRRVLQKVPGLRNLQHSFSAVEGFVPPRPIRPIEFMLPADASPAILETQRMDLKASVSEYGTVTRVELLSPKEEELVTLASYAAADWQFVPARLNEQAVASQVILHFRFDSN